MPDIGKSSPGSVAESRRRGFPMALCRVWKLCELKFPWGRADSVVLGFTDISVGVSGSSVLVSLSPTLCILPLVSVCNIHTHTHTQLEK